LRLKSSETESFLGGSLVSDQEFQKTINLAKEYVRQHAKPIQDFDR
jgi:hypothetical protein